MKRIYLYLITAAVALFSACSNDADGPEVPQGPQDVVLQIGITSEGLVTKASTNGGTDDGKAGEAYIGRLTALVFSGDNCVAIKDTLDTDDDKPLNTVGNILLKEQTYDILIVANASDAIKGITSKTALKSYTEAYSVQSQSHLLMVSEMKTVTLVAATEDGKKAKLSYNFLRNSTAPVAQITSSYTYETGEPIVLTRLVARIQLDQISYEIPDSKPNLIGSKFILDSVYIANVRPTTHIVPTDFSYEATSTAPRYFRGGPAPFEVVDKLISPDGTDGVLANLGRGYARETANAITLVDGDNENEYTKVFADTDANKLCEYAFENHAATEVEGSLYRARLIIVGEIISFDGQSLGRRCYQVELKDYEANKYLTRNKIYKVVVKIVGLGSEREDEKTPEDIAIQATVKVADWNVIDHYENIDDTPRPQ